MVVFTLILHHPNPKLILLDAYAKVWALIWNGAYNLDISTQSLVTERKGLQQLVTRVIALVHFRLYQRNCGCKMNAV